MEEKPRFMSGRWQRKLMAERPIAASFFVLLLTVPMLFAFRLGIDGYFGNVILIGLYIAGGCLLLGLLWLLISERRRWKERNVHIDAYMEHRHKQTHEQDPPND